MATFVTLTSIGLAVSGLPGSRSISAGRGRRSRCRRRTAVVGSVKRRSPASTGTGKMRRLRPFAHPRVNRELRPIPDDRPSATSLLRAPSSCLQPRYRGVPLRLPQCGFRFVESRRFSRLEGVGSAFRYHIPFQRIACLLSDLSSRHAGFHKRLKQ